MSQLFGHFERHQLALHWIFDENSWKIFANSWKVFDF